MSIGEEGAMIVADVRGEQRPPQDGIVTHLLKVRVGDVSTQFERARSFGVRVEPPTEREERDCTLEDLAGHRWQFTQTMRDVAPEVGFPVAGLGPGVDGAGTGGDVGRRRVG